MAVDQAAGVPDGWEVVSAAPPPAPAESTATAPVPRMPAGVPARGRGTQFNPTLPNQAVTVATTPLAHPTGIDAIDGMTSPVGLASLAAGGVGIARAGITGGAMAAGKELFTTAAPQLKYEATKSTLEHFGVPSAVAMPIAMMVSGYKKGAKGAAAGEAATAEGAAAQAATKVPAPTSPVETVSGGTPPPPSSPPAPVPASASPTPQAPPPDVMTRLSPATQASVSVPPATVANYPQKFLNEVAIQAKRQGVQLTDQEYAVAHALTKQGQTPTQAVAQIVSAKAWGQPLDVPTPPRPDAAKAYLDLRTQGKTHQQAVEAIAAQEQLRQRLGTPSSQTVKTRVDERNATKRWPKE